MKIFSNKKVIIPILLIIVIISIIIATIGINQLLIRDARENFPKQTVETQVKIMAEVKERLGNGFANVLIKIESNTEIERIIFPNEDGTSLTLSTKELTLAKDLKVELEKEYIVTVITKDGKTTNETIKIPATISDIVAVGDFVNYSVGNWTEEDINKVGTYYSGSSLPTTSEKFGGFAVGQSKDNGIKPTQYNANPKYNGGWRVLSKNSDGTINIVHAGTPEGYYVPRSVHNDSGLRGSINILGQYRDWTMYEDGSTDAVNTNYAVQGSAHCITTNEILEVNQTSTLRAIGVEYIYYYEISPGSPYYVLCAVNIYGSTGNRVLGNIGVRPVVTIKANVKATASEGQTTHDTPETAWNLSLNE